MKTADGGGSGSGRGGGLRKRPELLDWSWKTLGPVERMKEKFLHLWGRESRGTILSFMTVIRGFFFIDVQEEGCSFLAAAPPTAIWATAVMAPQGTLILFFSFRGFVITEGVKCVGQIFFSELQVNKISGAAFFFCNEEKLTCFFSVFYIYTFFCLSFHCAAHRVSWDHF